jgi:intracellular sulfur oxidation DsrE/DsrF family protein
MVSPICRRRGRQGALDPLDASIIKDAMSQGVHSEKTVGPRYFLIASRDFSESAGARRFLKLASDLARGGSNVSVFLVQNAVLSARGGGSSVLRELKDGGVRVLADDLSLRERGISADRLLENVHAASLDVVIDALSSETKVLWD